MPHPTEGNPLGQSPAGPPMVEITPVSQIPCRHCGSVCFRTRVERLGVMLHGFGRALIFLGYTLLIVALISIVLSALAQQGYLNWTGLHADMLARTAYNTISLEDIFGLLVMIIAGHLLAMERQVWLCAACGSLFDRSERVEMIHAERARKKQQAE